MKYFFINCKSMFKVVIEKSNTMLCQRHARNGCVVHFKGSMQHKPQSHNRHTHTHVTSARMEVYAYTTTNNKGFNLLLTTTTTTTTIIIKASSHLSEVGLPSFTLPLNPSSNPLKTKKISAYKAMLVY
eukprot:TRINITY_DN22922_c0_g2_i1.p1 TRINITY_DN22922_c0_g2~~TRINITY_DN22922_c0_g2_i1.p1  ORF type:complete len:128 (-),score=5.53 TRINITY_DN22922_c0_g2_i1:619-1002(-)